MKIKELVLQLVFPRVCPVCKEVLPWHINDSLSSTDNNPYICPECLKKLRPITGTRCLRCSKPIESEEGEFCEDCEKSIRYFREGKALWLHAGAAKRIVYDLKFSSRKDNADFIGYELARSLGRWLIYSDVTDIVPVPLHYKKQRSRGFNQAVLIASALAHWMEIMYGVRIRVNNSLIERTEKTRPQKDLDPKYRYNNVHGAFAARADANGLRICLLDDIYTTGSTINEAAKVLKQAGAQYITFITANIGI